MPPQIALIICIFFVLWLLRIESKQAPNVSHTLWIPTIWMLCAASKPLGVWFPSAGGDPDSGSPLDRAFLVGLICMGLVILAWKRGGWSSAIKGNKWLFLLIGYMFISIFWSDIPFISFKRWIRELTAVIMAFLILTEPSPREALESLLRRSVYILIPFSLLLIKYYHIYGVEYTHWSGRETWIGVCTQKNGLGRLCLISAVFLVWTLVRRWRGRNIPAGKYQPYVDVLLLIVTLWLLRGGSSDAYSATAVAALSAGLAMFFGLLWMKKCRIFLGVNTLTAIIAMCIVYGIAAPMVGGSTVEPFTSTLGRDETLTGRTNTWAELVPVAMKRPLFGGGFGSFWTPRTREFYQMSHAHNGYLDVLLELGFVGILLVSMFLLSCCRKAQRELRYDFDWASLWICYLLMTVLHNVTESSLNTFTSQMTAVLLFLAISSAAATSYTTGDSREV